MHMMGKRLVDRQHLDAFLGEAECASLTVAGENLILDITRDEMGNEDSEHGSGRLTALAPCAPKCWAAISGCSISSG